MKEIVALVGPYDATAKEAVFARLEKRFQIVEVQSEEQYGMLKDAQYMILRTLSIGKSTIEGCKSLKLIQRWGVGYDTVDIKSAGENGIPVAITSGVNAVSVAEYTVLLMLAVYRNLIKIHENVKSGKWRDTKLISRSYALTEKTVGLLGLGAIGRQVAAKVRGFGASVVYYDPVRVSSGEESELNIRYAGFEEILKTADIISLHLPLTEQTRNLINAETISMMKPSAVLINTARGEIVEERALYEALSERRILGAGLDVFQQEPVDGNNPLLTLDNVVLSAHSAGNTADNAKHMAERCAENIMRVAGNVPLSSSDLVNGQYLKTAERRNA